LRLSILRRGACAAALCSAITTGAGAVPAPALADPQGTPPNVTIAKVGVARERLHVRAGRSAAVIGTVRPGAAGYVARLQVWRKGRWRTLDRDRTSASGRYVLRDRVRATMSAPARVTVRGASDRERRRVGRLNVYRWALASWYGPGLYGNRTGCGGRLGYSQLGVAHRTLPCGTKVTLRHRGRSIRVRVIDRGPYVGAREYDLTATTARRLRFRGHGGILTTR
jgi:rare lipoprotein A